MKITFLGAGVFGTALSKIARYNGNEIKLYDPIKFPNLSLSAAINGSDCIVYTAPSNKHQDLLPELDPGTPLICASKGFLSEKPFQSFKHFSALGGAAFASELESSINYLDSDSADMSDSAINRPTAPRPLTFTASSELAEQLFSTENITIEYTEDALGIMLCGALKNVYAIAAGYQGEDENNSVSVVFLEKAITEMISILEANHASKDTLRLSCGAADLVLTCSEKSRNYRFGKALKLNDQTEIDNSLKNTVEGLSIIKDLNHYPEFSLPDSATIFKDIVNVITEKKYV